MSTIFAFATPTIKSGVAILRISGAEAGRALQTLTRKPLPKPRLAVLRSIFTPDSNEHIDSALVLWFPAPASFTGEDTCELHLHGSRAVISEMLQYLGRMPGLRLAEPGEFSRRAFEHNKMDLTEAEGLADLIDAETKMQARQASRQMQGIAGRQYDHWRETIIALSARVEAYIDFPDEDIPPHITNDIMDGIAALIQEISSKINDNRVGEKLRSGLSIVIIGAPNSGKSSLLNCLANRDVAIVSDHAGTTRDLIEVDMEIKGFPVTIVDTAGLRESQHDIEREGIKRALKKAEEADMKIVLFDATAISSPDHATLNHINEHAIVVVNKIDLIDTKIPLTIAGKKALGISVRNNIGISELLDALALRVIQYFSQVESAIITNERHRMLLEETLAALGEFDLSAQPELAAEHLRQASTSLGKITGRISVEDILDALFKTFCIGK